MNNYYEILGVSKDATKDEIKKAYRKLSKKLHPDTSTGDEEKFKKVREAYDVLSDDNKRAHYDNPDPFRDMFGGFNINFNGQDISDILNRARQRANVRGGDIQMTLHINAKESYTGVTKQVEYRRLLLDGTEEYRTISVEVPNNLTEQSRLRFTGGGHQGTRLDGDLFVYVSVGSYGKYERVGDNLVYRMSVNPLDLLLGKEEMVDLFNKKIKVKIPECVDINKPLKVKGMGYRGGDLVIFYDVVTPEKITDDVKEELKQIYNVIYKTDQTPTDKE